MIVYQVQRRIHFYVRVFDSEVLLSVLHLGIPGHYFKLLALVATHLISKDRKNSAVFNLVLYCFGVFLYRRQKSEKYISAVYELLTTYIYVTNNK